MRLTEELITFIWLNRLFSHHGLCTTDGQPVEVLNAGTRQHNAGPDLCEAQLRIGGTLWAGNIEIHTKASDWLRHGHTTDQRYGNIILHLVFDDDLEQPVGPFPTLQLAPFVSDQVLLRYANLAENALPIACGPHLGAVSGLTINHWLDRLLVQRLEAKTERIAQLINRCQGDLEQAFQAWMFRYLGSKVNDEAFEQLGLALPWKVLSKGRTDLMLTEALLFGTAGLLPDSPPDDHSAGLLREFRYLAHANNLRPMAAHIWRFNRLRPAAFPTVRLSQMAAIIHRHGPLLQAISNAQKPDDVRLLFDVEASGYWASRFRFGEVSTAVHAKTLGHDMVNSLIINAIVPFLFVRHHSAGREDLKEQLLDWLRMVPPENNRITRNYKPWGLAPTDAAQSQALLTLHTDFCTPRKCLHCAIGNQLLRSTAHERND